MNERRERDMTDGVKESRNSWLYIWLLWSKIYAGFMR